MKYLQIEFRIEPYSQTSKDLTAAIAGSVGFDSFNDEEGTLIGYCQESMFDKDKLDEALNEFPIEDTTITYNIEKVGDENWNSEWEKIGFSPIVIQDKCIIKSAKYVDEVSGADYPITITIDPCQAFGSGTHETTQLIVSVLLNLPIEGKRILDCGCGTGILGIVAAKCGAKEVVAYDIDEWSVKNTKHNAELNDVSIEALEGDCSVLTDIDGKFDYILANINRNILLNDMRAFFDVMSSQGTLILSGFYKEDVPLLLKHAANLGLRPVREEENHDWCCLVLKFA